MQEDKDKVIKDAQPEAGKERWIHSVCDMCYTSCGLIARQVDGIVVRVDGDPNCPHNWGKLCAKGNAGFLTLYDPERLRTPLKRTNPEKGIGVDPKWQEISWEEALDTVVTRLKKVREEDPRRLFFATFDAVVITMVQAWVSGFGSPNRNLIPAGYYCGAALHLMTYLTNATFHSEVDLEHCKYCLLIGNQHGFMAGVNPNINTQKMADARRRGMKLVVVDPQCGNAAAKADEWIPIKPGTDGAMALAMLNVLLNEAGIYDREFLRNSTNGPYLVGSDGRYMRDEATNKPLVWDLADKKAKTYDAEAGELALEGSYNVNGTEYRTAFQCLKEHVKEYTPEGVSPITSIDAQTIRRLALEFGQAASIGDTILIEGKEFPYRPVAVNQYRGAYSHKHGTSTALAIQLLNLVVGNIYAPGGHRGTNPVGPDWGVKAGRDGLMVAGHTESRRTDPYSFYNEKPGTAKALDLDELFPVAWERCPAIQLSLLNPERFGLPYKPEVLIHCRTNIMMTTADRNSMAEALKKIPFQVSFARELDETVEFADIVFPEFHYLERLDAFPNSIGHSLSPSGGYWYWGMRQPTMRPPAGPRHWAEVLLELAERVGFLPDVYSILNITYELEDPYKLKPNEKYTWEEMIDRRMKSGFGEEHDLSWFKEHGYLNFKRKVDENYPCRVIDVRIPIYYEHFLDAGRFVQESAKKMGLSWDTADFEPIPHWRPCPAYEENSTDFDLYLVNTTLPFHTYTITPANPWLDELTDHHAYARKVMINRKVAERKGIKDRDTVWVESVAGKVKGQAKLTECIHPEVLGIAAVFGSWAKGKPVGRGKGPHFNSLVPFSLDRIDPISNGLDACVKVKIYQAKE